MLFVEALMDQTSDKNVLLHLHGIKKKAEVLLNWIDNILVEKTSLRAQLLQSIRLMNLDHQH